MKLLQLPNCNWLASGRTMDWRSQSAIKYGSVEGNRNERSKATRKPRKATKIQQKLARFIIYE